MTLSAGDELGPRSYPVRRGDLIRYAGASGDFNPIHWSDRIATSVQLPGVVAHGMYTLAIAGRAVTDWVQGDVSAVESFGGRFTKPVVVPDDDDGTVVNVGGVVKSVEGGRATIEITVTSEGQKVLGQCRAVVRC